MTYMALFLNLMKLEYPLPTILTFPKKKHKVMKNDIDFRKIDGGNLGAINLNNMIPVKNSCLMRI